MNEWSRCSLGDVCKTISDTYRGDANEVVLVNTSDVLEGKCLNHQKSPNKDLKGQFKKTFQRDDILYSEIRPANKRYAYIDFDGTDYIASTKLMVIRHEENIIPQFLFYIITSQAVIDELQMLAESRSGTFPQITFSELANLRIELPPLSEQAKIVRFLKSLDDKIEVNRRINDNFRSAFLVVMLILLLTSLRNDNLGQQAQALFKSWFIDFDPFKDGEFEETELGFIPKDWKVVSLSAIADYINGLAMQKYRPTDGESGLPVLKIKELGQGRTDDSSELCSPSLIGSKYIIDDGDIIFSWSGTLMVKVWCGGKCGLNQHLFVVKPKEYPKWFAYQWTKHHLDNFIHIAKDKAVTMGHIKRGELDKAKIVVPDETNMATIDLMMKPLHNQIISNMKESRRLANLRDTLLPRLMSGELKVNEIENVI